MIPDTLFTIIESYAVQHGRAEAEAQCKKFLRMKRTAGVTIKRKPINRAWVDEAYAKQDALCFRCKEFMKRSEATGDHKLSLADGKLSTASYDELYKLLTVRKDELKTTK